MDARTFLEYKEYSFWGQMRNGHQSPRQISIIMEEYYQHKIEESQTLTTHEDQHISDFAKQVKELVTKEWGSHNLDAFVEAFKGEG